MPGLLRGIVRTAAIAGTATAVSNRVSRRQAGRWARHDAQQQQAYARPQQQEAYAPEDARPPADDMEDKLDQLERLGNPRSAACSARPNSPSRSNASWTVDEASE
jgi:hypothetical protein